jgi:hypothetical protein
MKSNYSILVNTCDKFEDCWEPFFKLFSIYWKDCNAQIFLNTEYKNYSYENLKIHSLKVCEQNKDAHKITWSECLIRALNTIDSDVVLYLQEDYFLKSEVNNACVEKYVQLMTENKDIDCIHLTDQAVIASSTSDKYQGLYNVELKQRYKISCQAALWRKDTLLSYLRSYENAWQFEEFASKRSALSNHNFFVVDKKVVIKDKFEIIPYIFTGIVQGRWFEDVVPLFKKHKINVDFQKRGFLKEAPKRKLKVKLKHFVNKIPITLKSEFELFKLKLF